MDVGCTSNDSRKDKVEEHSEKHKHPHGVCRKISDSDRSDPDIVTASSTVFFRCTDVECKSKTHIRCSRSENTLIRHLNDVGHDYDLWLLVENFGVHKVASTGQGSTA